MRTNWQDAALGMAGVIGCCVAVFHGILTQRLMVRPLEEFFLTDKRISASIKRLMPLLLHFSTISWFLGGLALIVAANWFEQNAKLALNLCNEAFVLETGAVALSGKGKDLLASDYVRRAYLGI